VAQAAAVKVKRRRSVGQVLHEMRREWSAYVFISPGLLFFIVFNVYAIIVSFYLSFHEYNLLQPAKPYVGAANYRQLLHDDKFWHSVQNTLIMSILGIPATMILGLLIALLLNAQIRGLSLFRTAFYLPVVTPLVVAAIIWKWVYNSDYGLANYYLQRAGLIQHPLLWLSSVKLALPAVVIMGIWKSVGFSMVVYLAGLQSIPQEYYEAAEVDGAGASHRFRRITLPLLAPTTFFLLVISFIGAMQSFEQIYIMTNGGPPTEKGGATSTAIFYIYQTAFKFFDMGYASALAYALFAMLFVVTVFQFRFYTRTVES
jgi:multiple sugar transport system permease protein